MSKAKPMVNKTEDARATSAIADVKTITPYEQYQQDYFKRYTDWQNRAGPKDITTAPGMEDYANIYGNAQALASKQRVGDPVHAFTTNLPGFTNQLQQQKQMEMYGNRAAGLSDAYRGLQAQALGAGQGAAGMETSRLGDYAKLSQAYNQSYYGRPVQQPLWQTIAGLAIGGLGAAGGMMSGMGALTAGMGASGSRPH